MTCINRGFLLPSLHSSVPVLCNAVFVLSGLVMVRQRLSSSWKQMLIANWSLKLGFGNLPYSLSQITNMPEVK